jgi:hypothetical protein
MSTALATNVKLQRGQYRQDGVRLYEILAPAEDGKVWVEDVRRPGEAERVDRKIARRWELVGVRSDYASV